MGIPSGISIWEIIYESSIQIATGTLNFAFAKPCNITRLRMSLDIADIGPLAVVMQKLSISMGIMPFKTTSLLDKPKEQRRECEIHL